MYRSYYTDNIADANHRFTVDLTAHVRMPQRRGDVLEGIVMCAPVTDEEREADVVRFLEQATLGPTEALVQEVKAKGIAAVARRADRDERHAVHAVPVLGTARGHSNCAWTTTRCR